MAHATWMACFPEELDEPEAGGISAAMFNKNLMKMKALKHFAHNLNSPVMMKKMTRDLIMTQTPTLIT